MGAIRVLDADDLSTTEQGGQAKFQVVLARRPTARVTIDLSSDDTTEGSVAPQRLVFTADNWDARQSVTVTGVDDPDADGTVDYKVILAPAVSDDATYDELDANDVSLQNLDDDSPGLLVASQTGESLRTDETGQRASFTVVLLSRPTAPVELDVVSDDPSEVSVGPARLLFSPSNWNAPQSVTATGVDDDAIDGDVQVRIQVGPPESDDEGYASLEAEEIVVTNGDDDTPGIDVQVSQPLFVTENGLQRTFTVSLETEPASEVSLPVASDDTDEITVSPAALTFTPDNWKAPQSVIVTGVNDDIADGDQTANVVLGPTASDDAAYEGLEVAPVEVTNLDNDGPGVLVLAEVGLAVSESGSEETFAMVLRSQPDADVTVNLESADPAEVVVGQAQVVFTPINWGAPQLVTVTGVDDEERDGNQVVRIITSDTSSTDPRYDGLVVDDVEVINIDLDSAGVLVDAPALLSTSENGDQDQFSVALNTRPTANVVIGVTSKDETEVSLSPGSLTFTPDNWAAPQVVTVTGVDDTLIDGNQRADIEFARLESDDPSYNDLYVPPLTAENVDNDTPGLSVEPRLGLATFEDGSQDELRVVLTSQPKFDVTVPIASTNAAEGTVSPQSLIFTPVNWNAPQTVILTGVDDEVADGNRIYSVSVGPAESDDDAYDGISVANVLVVNMDNDTPGFRVAEADNLSTYEDGRQDTFTVALSSKPSANVEVPLASTAADEGTVSPATLTFTPDNWAAPQLVTVTGVDDEVADGDQPYGVRIGPATSADLGYQGRSGALVDVTNVDDDSPGVDVVAASPLITNEGGGQASFTVALTSEPTAMVNFAVSLSKAEARVVPATFTFTPSDWNAPRTVTLTGFGDLIQDGNQAYFVQFAALNSADPNYNGLSVANLPAINLDNDGAAISVLTSALTTTEGGDSITFSVVLNAPPAADVTIPLVSDDVGEGTVSPAQLTFTSLDWDQPQQVTVTGENDDVQDGNQNYQLLIGPASSSDPAYGGRTVPNLVLSNTDDDSAGISLADTTGLVTSEPNGQDTFTVVLTSEPVADVVIPLGSSDLGEIQVQPASLTFTAGNWDQAQTVTLTGQNDDVRDRSQQVQISVGPASSADPNYAGRALPNVVLLNQDDDVASVVVDQAPSLTTGEAGTQTSFTVVLTSEPTAVVVVPVVSSDTGEGTLDVTEVAFNAANWDTPQTVTITGVDDDYQDGDQSYAITVGPAVSDDPEYNGFVIADVAVTNEDDDDADVVVNAGAIVTHENGAQASFTVALQSRPFANVIITLVSTRTGEATLSVGQLTFTEANWNVPQTVTLTGQDEDIDDDDQSYQVQFTVASDDADYDGIAVTPVSGQNTDDDTAGFDVTPLKVTTFELSGSDTFTVALTSEPLSDVTIPVASLDASEGTTDVASLSFTPQNWDTPQTVTVTGLDDGILDGNQVYTVGLSPASSSDPKYAGLDPDDVTVDSIEAAYSCQELITIAPGLTDGVYQLDTDRTGPNPQFEAFCDMTTAGGGWTLLSWNGDTDSTPFGVPYPGLAYCSDLSCARGSGVPAGSLNALFDRSSELAQGQSTTTQFTATFDVLGNYEYAGRFDYGSLADLTVLYAPGGCSGLTEGTYYDITNTVASDEAPVYLNQGLFHGGSDPDLSDYSSEDHDYIWSLGNSTDYCEVNNTMPASFLGTWGKGQYGPAVVSAAGSYSIWVR